MVTLPAPTPTEAMPAPEKLSKFENVPVELLVVLPSAVNEIEEVWIAGDGTEIVTLPAPTPTEAMPAPEKLSSVLNEPEELEVVLPSAVKLCVWMDCVAEIVALPAPTPTLTMPAPDRLSKLENVPEELLVVLPSAVNEIEEVWIAGVGTEIVTLPAPTPTEAIPAPEKFNRFENVPVELLVVFPKAVREIEEV